MPECARCGATTDDATPGDYAYCADCRDRFAAVERDGVVVEDRAEGDVDALVIDGSTGARWVVDAYLDARPALRERVDGRRAGMDDPDSEGLLDRLRDLL